MYIGSTELMERTGITVRQLNYWCRAGVIPTIGDPWPGSGHRRQFERDAVDRVRLLVHVSNCFNHIVATDLLKIIYDNYHIGSIDLGDGLILTWG